MAKHIAIVLLTLFLTVMACFRVVTGHGRPQELVALVCGSVLGWAYIVYRGKLPGWAYRWPFEITEDHDSRNLPTLVYLPIILLAVTVLVVLILWVSR